jgi:hypothetical protein
MSEVSDFLKNIVDDFNSKISEIYTNKMLEHRRDISCNLSDGYTEKYGELNTDSLPSWSSDINRYILSIDENRYIIQHTSVYKNVTNNKQDIVIDNYGDFIMIPNENNTPYKYNSISKYILPNILIDTIKNFSSGVRLSNYINFLQQIQIISKDYYNRFTKYKSLHQSEEQQKEDNSKKNILIKSLREENNKLNNLIATIKEKNNEADKLKQLNNKYIKTIVELNTQNVKKCASESDSESDDNSSDSESESASAPETESDSDANV